MELEHQNANMALSLIVYWFCGLTRWNAIKDTVDSDIDNIS